MTRKSLRTLSLAGAAILALGAAACSPDKDERLDNPRFTGAPVTTVTEVETATRTHTPPPAPAPRETAEFSPEGVNTEYTPSEISFMKAACGLYDEGNSAMDVLFESFVMPETVPLEHDPERVGELIIMAIPEFCPRHADEIDKFANDWA